MSLPGKELTGIIGSAIDHQIIMGKHLMKMKPLLVMITALFTLNASALAADRVYDDSGSVWTVGYIETKPGHFDDYIANLHSIWKRYLDEQKKDGSVLSYKMIAVGFPRDGEPNLMLMVEYKNYAAFDRGNAYFDELAKKLQGGTEQATQSNIDREALRELRGGWVGRELTFKN